jgi:glycine/D-amino acid oxidase-like deaminating enzyme
MKHYQVAIVGAGFSGLGMAIRLKQEGIDDFVVLERAEALGGTWRDNRYPGCQCDVESNLYSFSFAPNPAWTRLFPLQQEIWDYLERCADRYAVRGKIRFNHAVTSAEWRDDDSRWLLRTEGGELTADFLVGASGPLSEPSLPDLPGLFDFEGGSTPPAGTAQSTSAASGLRSSEPGPPRSSWFRASSRWSPGCTSSSGRRPGSSPTATGPYGRSRAGSTRGCPGCSGRSGPASTGGARASSWPS